MAEAVRRLTEKGVERFRDYLKELREGGNAIPPRSLLTDSETSESFSLTISIEHHPFIMRIEVARYLAGLFGEIKGLEEDVGLWSWLSLFYFDQVCPAGYDGTRSPGRDYRHILEPGYLYGHRHLLGGPFVVYRQHGEPARLLLCTKINRENLFHHELASRQTFISNPTIIEAASRLYFDDRAQRPKRGAQESKSGPGTLRRFVDVIQQLELNYDLYSMSAAALVGLLPTEFDEWRQKKRSLS
jgi:hypothetical protein